MDDHELTAAYALDALDAEERQAYETHLATCARCRDELQSFWRVSGSLAHAAAGPPPPPELRGRILDAARAERPNVVPLRPRWTRRVAAPAAAVAAVAAVALGVWGVSVSRELDAARQELAIVGDPNAQTFETRGGEASLIVTPTGEAALVVRKLAPAPPGKDYEIWVFVDGTPRPAGVFERPGVTVLTHTVERGQTVAVTLERDGGVDAPTTDPVFTAPTL